MSSQQSGMNPHSFYKNYVGSQLAQYTPFQNAFAVLLGSWSNSLTRGPSLIVTQYIGTEITVHYCGSMCSCYKNGLKCIGVYDDGFCKCTNQHDTCIDFPDQLMKSLQSMCMSIIDFTNCDNVFNTSDYLLDFIVDELTNSANVIDTIHHVLHKQKSQSTDKFKDFDRNFDTIYINEVLAYNQYVITALFKRRHDKLATIIKLPPKNINIWQSCSSFGEYNNYVIESINASYKKN
ncbi:MAG: hypothetical protein Faunusvirus8_24 [Faunusvirus sp.]|jgi:hypothetical protein|uniref:Uncharacterized protein n=1 Tax=Faunusvirus sp. TaxID=2487766 RepID=A0A3G4ZWL8_9VIRU|nr:MAG: hypothetical protein Faunusvirus8_24 [Faunusvirus sp.]